MTILVIEDDDNLRELVVESLQDAGYAVLSASNPDLAIGLARQRRLALALSDVRMAGSTDGIGALEAIKKIQPRIRTIIMTGFASLEAPLRAAKISADDYLLKGDKSFGVAELLRVVRSVLERDEVTPLAWWEKLLAWPGRKSLATKLPTLEAQRKTFLNSLFLLIRSAHISKEAFWESWRCLLPLERAYLDLQEAEAIPPLVERYVSQGLLETPDAFGLKREQVWELYDRVRLGLVEAWQFEQAATLWLSAEERRESPRNYVVYRLLWGPREELDPSLFEGKTLGRVTINKRLTSIGDVQRFEGTLEGRAVTVEMVRRGPDTEGIDNAEIVEPYLMVIRNQAAGKLEQQLREPRTPQQAAELLEGVFQQVLAGHEQGIFDGCLGPHRIFTTTFGARLDTFGPARFRDLITNLNVLGFGEIAHLAPEIRSARDEAALTAQADQFSLGSIFLQVLLGLPSRQFLGLMLENNTVEEPVIQRMMARNPAERYPTLRQAHQALQV